MNEREIFIAALQIESAAQRRAYVEAACGEDEGFRRGVEALLSVHERAGSFLEHPLADPVATTDDPLQERPGTAIGPYKLMEQIGEGGMGLVFVAEQQQPVRRKVALKVIKPGMDTRQVVARFEAERQALAIMDHPNIAKVLDGGTTAGGRPYFVMELVKGVPITEYCDQNQVAIRERLDLFVSVCQAVQHAHQKGIIHRDLKPSNVLVMSHDGTPVVKVIDFGVAKAIGQQLTDKTIYTQFSQMVGTPLYMSPEQAGQSGLDVDTRSDIYSLGVLLYELLTGTTPFDRQHLREASYDEIRRVIREEEPPKPSTRISTLGKAATTVSTQRQSEPKQLSRLVRGELDWIVMKALEKDRNRRYETANGLGRDVERYLNDEPVQACPPSAGYRLRKFARRNKGPVLAATLVTLALVGGTIGTTWGMFRATKAEADAKREASEKTVALREKETALTAAKANEIQAKAAQKDAQENLKDALAAVEQMLTRVADGKLLCVPQMEPIRRDLLLDALNFYQKFLQKQADDPVIRRETCLAHRRLGRIHHQLGQYQDAARCYRNTLEMYDKLDSSISAEPALRREMVSCHIEFGWTLGELRNYEEALKNYRRAVELADKLDKEAPDNRPYILNARNQLAAALIYRRPDEAESILKENLALAADASSLQGAHHRLGELFSATQRLPEAEKCFRRALQLAEQIAKEIPTAYWAQDSLARELRLLAKAISAQRPREAEEMQRRALLILEKLATDFRNSPQWRRDLVGALFEHARYLMQLGQASDADKACRRAIDIYGKQAKDFPGVPASWQELADGQQALADHLHSNAQPQEAEKAYREVIAALTKAIELDSNNCTFRIDRGTAYKKLRQYDQALADYSKAIELDPKCASAHRNLGLALKDQGKLDEAIACWRKTIELDPNDAVTHGNLGRVLHRQGQLDEALAEYTKANKLDPRFLIPHNKLAWTLATHSDANVRNPRQAVALAQKAVHENPKEGHYWNTLGVAQYRVGDWKEAISALQKYRELRTDDAEWSNPFFLAMAHWQLNNKEEARKWRAKAIAWVDERDNRNTDLLRRVRVEMENLMTEEPGIKKAEKEPN